MQEKRVLKKVEKKPNVKVKEPEPKKKVEKEEVKATRGKAKEEKKGEKEAVMYKRLEKLLSTPKNSPKPVENSPKPVDK